MKSFFFLLIPAVVLIRLGFPPFNLAPCTLAGWAILLYYFLSERRTAFSALGGAWLAGFLWNLSMTFYVAFPHWATSIGWVALSAYLAFYWLVWIWGCRLAVKKQIPLWFAAPVLWTGLELIQGHLLSGFLLNQQAIAFYKAPIMLQLAEFGGSYIVSFILMELSVLIYYMCKNSVDGKSVYPHFLSMLLIVVLVAGSGFFLLKTTNDKQIVNNSQSKVSEFSYLFGETEPTLNLALIQGNVPCQVEYDPDTAKQTFGLYCAKSFDSLAAVPRPDVIVWPEGVFRYPRLEIGDNEPVIDPDFMGSKEEYLEQIRQNVDNSQKQVGIWAKSFDACFITGVDRCVLSGEDILRYNSIVGVDSFGRNVGQYDKRHLVLFGEYIPFAETFPILKEITPVGGGMQAGKQISTPLTFTKANPSDSSERSDWTFLPSICYENTLPHVIRAQVLNARKPVDALLNLSNDGWFRGCFENELRMAQSVFRAIETRKTHIVVSNGGISAYISPSGYILQQGHREIPSFWGGTVEFEYINVLLKKSGLQNYVSKYVQYGDAFAAFCLFLSLIILFYPMVRPSKSLKPEEKDGGNGQI